MNLEFCPHCDAPDAVWEDPRISSAICYRCYTTFCTVCENQLPNCDCDPPPILKQGPAPPPPNITQEQALRAFTDK